MEELQYHEQRDLKNKKKLQELLAALPPFCADFFRGIEPATSSMTRLSYAYDISTFFDFLRKLKPELEKLSVENISLEQLCAVTIQDLERYLEYLKDRPDDPEHKNVNKEQIEITYLTHTVSNIEILISVSQVLERWKGTSHALQVPHYRS